MIETFFTQDVCITPKAIQTKDVKHVYILFLKHDEELTKPLNEDVLLRFKSCLRRDGNPQTMSPLFGIPCVKLHRNLIKQN